MDKTNVMRLLDKKKVKTLQKYYTKFFKLFQLTIKALRNVDIYDKIMVK